MTRESGYIKDWRYRCPNCGSNQTWKSMEQGTGGSEFGKRNVFEERRRKRYRCGYCYAQLDELLDAKTNDRVKP